MILVIDTADNEKAFLGLWVSEWLKKEEWSSGRNLSADILIKLEELYDKSGKTFKETTGIIVNSGPGSFTGLRIGISVANTIAYSLNIPVVGCSDVESYQMLLLKGQQMLSSQKNFKEIVLPKYGKEPNITQPKNSKAC
ncbi:MAG: tRNA (adenosine(37)-N6)-threonylcarbamoyltransferase complex dimerization subunit type 1 TsaB [Patescibacteria group bacterium]|nr:tRNA (adenosine(37)-N6)-threonylcarbamoyltransferase complex dimerization subunit type 1 TsaB [Patescibacteria group bacterium]